jgi:hypothetical protein
MKASCLDFSDSDHGRHHIHFQLVTLRFGNVHQLDIDDVLYRLTLLRFTAPALFLRGDSRLSSRSGMIVARIICFLILANLIR